MSAEDASARIAIVVGATGLVGSALCRQLQRDGRYDPVVVLTRRPLPLEGPPLQVETIDFSRLDEWKPEVAVDTVFCALGTTMHKAGSEVAFRAVDQDLVLAVARLARRARARHFVMVSSIGANASAAPFYLRVKGETEDAVAAMDLPHVAVLRPSLLTGERTERRPSERWLQLAGRLLAPLMIGKLARYRPIAGEDVATAMRVLAASERAGFEVIETGAIGRLVRSERVLPF